MNILMNANLGQQEAYLILVVVVAMIIIISFSSLREKKLFFPFGSGLDKNFQKFVEKTILPKMQEIFGKDVNISLISKDSFGLTYSINDDNQHIIINHAGLICMGNSSNVPIAVIKSIDNIDLVAQKIANEIT